MRGRGGGFRRLLSGVTARHCNLSRNDNLAFFCTHSIDACHICWSASVSNFIISASFSGGQSENFLQGSN